MTVSRFVWGQLVIFALVTVVAVTVIATGYARLPQLLGIGQNEVTLQLPASGGLYDGANVTYRGTQVGKVRKLRLTSDGIAVSLSLDSDKRIPANVAAAVHSMSAVGEQYVNLTVPAGTTPTGRLRSGAVLTSNSPPTDVSDMIDRTNALLAQINDTQLRGLLDEAFTAFNGSGPDLQRLLDSVELLAASANDNADVTTRLIDEAGPLLRTQSSTVGDIRQWTKNLTSVTDQLRANDPQLRGIVTEGPGVATQTQQLFDSMKLSIPLLVDNLGTASKTMAIYHNSLRQIIVLYPRLIAMLGAAVNKNDYSLGPTVDFHLQQNDPPPCTVGYLPPSQWRSPAIQTPRALPPGLLCRVPQDSPTAVRGARNFPCVQYPGRRAPTPKECADGYRPLGENKAFPKGIFGQPSGYVMQGGTATSDDGSGVYAASYDPVSGDYIGPDGNTYDSGLGTTERGEQSWQSLIRPTNR